MHLRYWRLASSWGTWAVKPALTISRKRTGSLLTLMLAFLSTALSPLPCPPEVYLALRRALVALVAKNLPARQEM